MPHALMQVTSSTSLLTLDGNTRYTVTNRSTTLALFVSASAFALTGAGVPAAGFNGWVIPAGGTAAIELPPRPGGGSRIQFTHQAGTGASVEYQPGGSGDFTGAAPWAFAQVGTSVVDIPLDGVLGWTSGRVSALSLSGTEWLAGDGYAPVAAASGYLRAETTAPALVNVTHLPAGIPTLRAISAAPSALLAIKAG